MAKAMFTTTSPWPADSACLQWLTAFRSSIVVSASNQKSLKDDLLVLCTLKSQKNVIISYFEDEAHSTIVLL